MPVCRKCERRQATAEVRRTTRGHVCKDKVACLTRQAAARSATVAIRATIQRLDVG